MKKPTWARAVVAVFAFLFLAAFPALVSAGVTAFVAEGQDGEYYEYSYEELLRSYARQLRGNTAPLFSDYSKKEIKALLDDVNGYVDYEDVLRAYAGALRSGNSFDMNKYTASKNAKPAEMPGSVFVTTLDSSDKLQYTAKILDPVIIAVGAVNEADSTAAMRSELEKHCNALGLDLADYNNLTSHLKNLVAAGVLENRPKEGYPSAALIQDAFSEETGKAEAVLDASVNEVNSASDKNGIIESIINNAGIFDISLTLYNMINGSEKESVAEHVFSRKPFSSALQVKEAFNTAVMAVTSRVTIIYTGYNYTFEQVLDKQMNRSPQTDLYGGGWKNALRDDVAFFVNPVNFATYNFDDSMEIVQILSALNVREKPTTNSDRLTTVYTGDEFLIKGSAPSEPDTSSGTEGIWYKITANNRTGWVSGNFVEVTSRPFTSQMFQFLVLSGNTGITRDDIGNILKNRGILHGKESSFIEGSLMYNVNEIFLVSLALHETGNGTSQLANGIDFPDTDNLFPDEDTVKVYNFFGIGAYDDNPNYYGAEYAYNKRWFTPEEAILGGAEFTSLQYVNHPTFHQDTLYKMRWNPGSPGNHQYATDIAWAAKQVRSIKRLYDQCTSFQLFFDIPTYKE